MFNPSELKKIINDLKNLRELCDYSNLKTIMNYAVIKTKISGKIKK